MGFVTGQRLLGAAVVLAGALAFMPSKWMAPWSGDVAQILTLPVRPVERGLAALGGWLQTEAKPYPHLHDEVAAMAAQRDTLQGELDRERLRSLNLEAQLAELRMVVSSDARGGWRPVLAAVVERPTGKRPGQLGIHAGSTDGVAEGDPVVAGGNRLIGRILGPVERSRAWVLPVDIASGRIDALVFPANRVGASAGAGTMVQLVASGDSGVLLGEIDTQASVAVGDVVLLNDATWTGAAQGMRLGVVEHVGALDKNPLRKGLTVRMDIEPARVSSVTVKVTDANAPARAVTPPGGRK